MADGFQIAMVVTAAFAAAGGGIAWVAISADVLETTASSDGAATPDRLFIDRSCGVAGTPLRPPREADCGPTARDAEVVATGGSWRG